MDDVIKKFGLKEADKSIHHYSGGMKRKLSVAIAMLGEPPVVLLVRIGYTEFLRSCYILPLQFSLFYLKF